MAQIYSAPGTEPAPEGGRIGELIHRITDDVKVIARAEVEIARSHLEHSAKLASTDAGIAVIGAVVALIGLGFACTAAVVGLAHAIPLWASLLIMAAVYVVVGGGIAAIAASKLRGAAPDLKVPVSQGARTLKGIKESIQHS